MLTLDTPPLSVSTDFVPNHRILIVEDEEVIRDMIILALEEEGYEALGVSDGRVALELLQSQESNHGESRFDLVVLVIRRQGFTSLAAATVRKFRDVLLYTQECRVTVRDEEINLSPKEFRLLDLFMSYPRRVWSREQLIEQIWGPDFLGDTKTVDVHIRWLREKLEIDPSQPEYLITVRGFGYRFG